jgi:hypothetical protein
MPAATTDENYGIVIRKVTGRHNIVTFIAIARQLLYKHIPGKRTHATEGRPLLDNGPVNTPL